MKWNTAILLYAYYHRIVNYPNNIRNAQLLREIVAFHRYNFDIYCKLEKNVSVAKSFRKIRVAEKKWLQLDSEYLCKDLVSSLFKLLYQRRVNHHIVYLICCWHILCRLYKITVYCASVIYSERRELRIW